MWTLLRQHVSPSQLAGFSLANLFGMFIVLLGFQFYHDVSPVFRGDDSFLKNDYIILSKRMGAAGALSGHTRLFSTDELDEVAAQPFANHVGAFTSAEYSVEASFSIGGSGVGNTDFFFESVPDHFVSASRSAWQWHEGQRFIPIILPRAFLTMYNFGFAHRRPAPKLSEGMVSLIDLKLFVHGNGHDDQYVGRVIGFSSRINTILVPESFMRWSNARYAPTEKSEPSRLIVEVGNPADKNVARWLDEHGYQTDDDKLGTEKTAYFLRVVVTMVMAVGGFIALLSFYILMLSVYLLVQKNSYKIENLLLIGYSPGQVARPYQWLTLALSVVVLALSLVLLVAVRSHYMDVLVTLFPQLPDGSLLPSLLLGAVLVCLSAFFNAWAIRHKITSIWRHQA